jgi:hypothetical protein
MDEVRQVRAMLYPWVLFNLMNSLSGRGETGRLHQWGPYFGGAVRVVVRSPYHALEWSLDRRCVEWIEAGSRGKAFIGFLFPTARGALRFFEKGVLLPWHPIGVLHLFSWIRLIRDMLWMQSKLKSGRWELLDEAELVFKSRLLLMAGVAGIDGLASLDAFTRSILDATPSGVMRFSIRDSGIVLGLVQVNGGKLDWVSDAASIGADMRGVDCEFEDVRAAWKSLSGIDDNLAAVGMGRVRLNGYLPLADAFNHLMDRLQIFLKPG